jgi:hypothetical protein
MTVYIESELCGVDDADHPPSQATTPICQRHNLKHLGWALRMLYGPSQSLGESQTRHIPGGPRRPPAAWAYPHDTFMTARRRGRIA